ncbi:phage head morphogenesis protein [Klebsiella michiganensis]|uniref:phage minor head protein n=1 Tax=Klebsiella michiganensis TaxID=1134687 RepID=UPI00191F3229|nr:phage minor head protein [Klebsiella michiganensis]MBL0813731.1 phage head morphogenesis protein [Klebsiella michiganensis]
MAKSEPRYDAGYPLAIELVYAQRLGDNARLVGKWVRDACIKTYKAIGKSGAVLNTDAADGKDISVDDLLGDFIAAATVKKVRVYIKKKAGSNYSRMTREQQEKLVRSVAQELLPDASIFLKAIPSLLKDGEFGAVPAYAFSEVRRQAGISLAKDFARVTGSKPDTYLRVINRTADDVQAAIVNGQFGLTDEYYQSYYQRFRVDCVNLIDLKTGLSATPDTAGAISKPLASLTDPMRGASTVPSLPAMEAANTQLANSAVDDFRLIIRAAADTDLAPGIKLPAENMADLISIDIYDGDKKLLEQTADWLTESMGRMENVSDEALQRGIKVVQQGLREGRGVDYIADKLATEMEIPYRRACNVARNEIGNQAWNLEETNARIAGMKIYRWRGMLDERERKLHVEREGKAYEPTRPPQDGNPGQPHLCRCFPEWLFSASDVEEAEKEIAARNTGQR